MGWRGPMTHRQYLAWSSWLHQQWNEPTREDYYQMQTAFEVKKIRASLVGGEGFSLGGMKIPFKEPQPPLSEEAKAAAMKASIAASKAAWFGAVGYKPPPKK